MMIVNDIQYLLANGYGQLVNDWVEDLETCAERGIGQTTGTLKEYGKENYCCLGRLVRVIQEKHPGILEKAGVEEIVTDLVNVGNLGHGYYGLVMQPSLDNGTLGPISGALGISCSVSLNNPFSGDTAVFLNDNRGFTFEQIAQKIKDIMERFLNL